MYLRFYLLCNQVVCILHCSFSQLRDYKTQRCIFKIENRNLEKKCVKYGEILHEVFSTPYVFGK